MNHEIAQAFRDIAGILEIKGENRFRIRAYERAAQNIERLNEDINEYIRKDSLSEIPGIGKDLSEKIKEFAKTGGISLLVDLKKTIPEGLPDLLKIPSVGPRTASLLYKKLNIKNVADLERAIAEGKLGHIFGSRAPQPKGPGFLPGIREKTVKNMLRGIDLFKSSKERMTLGAAIQIANVFIDGLSKLKGIKRIDAAGSLRRCKETVRDIDILVASNKPQEIMKAFTELPQAKEIIASGETKSSVRTTEDIQVDCRAVSEKKYGATLLYFTGSKNFNIKLRQMAIKKGMKLNEYGIFKEGLPVAAGTEKEIFKALGLAYIPPELREDTGEIELAGQNKLPELIELSDIRGDLHVHSLWSDGNNTIGEMAGQAQKIGYSYLGVTDHSQSLIVANGLSCRRLKKKKKEIEGLNKSFKKFRLLFSTEVDIDSNGKIDYSNRILAEFDIVVAAIHTGFKQSKQQLTKRVIAACNNKYVNIISHPTGRLWGSRDPYDIDFQEILHVARETNTILELNAFPQRLDLDSRLCRWAKDSGVRVSIDTDAHDVSQLSSMNLGVCIARRGWLSKEDCINTLTVDKLLETIKK